MEFQGTHERLQDPQLGRKEFLLTAVWLGLMSGMLEGFLYLAFQRGEILEWDEALVSVGPQQVFVSAVTNVTLLLVIAILLALLNTGIRWRHWPVTSLGFLVFLSLLPLVDLSGRIQMRGSVILTIGLSVQSIRWMGPRRAKLQAAMRRTLPALAGFAILAGVAVWWGGPLAERIQSSRLPPANPSAPNVLLIVLDTVRADHLSSYGYDRATTPHLDALASQGIQFENAYASSSWTLPSHATLFTGLLPSEHGATVRRDRSPLQSDLPVLSETLAAHGYVTAGFAANTTWLTPWMGLHRGFLHFESYYFSLSDAVRRSYYGRQIRRRVLPRLGVFPANHPSAPHLNEAFLAWVDRNPRRPFFAFFNFMEAHAPNPVPPSFAGRFRGASAWSRARIGKDTLTDAETKLREEWIGKYDTALHYLDSELGRLFDELKRRGLWENLLIIVTSDHGETFGGHHLFDHGNSLYEEVLHVPLVIRIPGGGQAGRRVLQRVSQLDLPATVLSLLGAQHHALGGRSLAEFWENPSALPRPVIAEVDGAPFPQIPRNWPVRTGWLKSITQERWKLILHQDGSQELYDLASDPLERVNLALQAAQRRRVLQLRQALEASTRQGQGD